MNVNANKPVGTTHAHKANPAEMARQQIAANPADGESPFGKLVSEIAKNRSTAPTEGA